MAKIKHWGNSSKIVLGFALVLLLHPMGIASAAKTSTIKAEVLEARAIEFVQANIPWDKDTTEIEIKYGGQDVVVPRGVVDMDFNLPVRRVRTGRFPVTVRITVNNILQKRLRLTAHVTHYAPVVKTLRPINRGEILTAGDVVVEVMPSNRIVRNAMTSLDDVVGNQAIRNMGIGRVVTTSAINKPTLVKKGDQVTIIAQSGAMKITAPGIVRQKGFKNSLVKVLNIQTQKTVFGMVQDAKTVKVNF
jgi:flagella basal body P-ring formation protein FlgA